MLNKAICYSLMIAVLFCLWQFLSGCNNPTGDGGSTPGPSPAPTPDAIVTLETSLYVGLLNNVPTKESGIGSLEYAWVIDSGNPNINVINDIFMKFDLSGIPGTVSVDAGTLKVFVTTYEARCLTSIYQITAEWDAATITATTEPGRKLTAEITKTSTLEFNTFDITQLVRGWVSGTATNEGIMIRPYQSTDFINPNNNTIADLDDASNYPRIEIFYH